MIKISVKDASALEAALGRIVKDAEDATIGAVKGMVGYALAYLVPRTPQWSGELVSQWRVTRAGAPPPPYAPHGYKDDPDAPWPVEKGAQINPYHAVYNPNYDAILTAREIVEDDVRDLVASRELLRGAAIWLPYENEYDDEGFSVFRQLKRHPGFSNVLGKVDNIVSAKFSRVTSTQARSLLKSPFPWAAGERGARTAYNFHLGVRKENQAKRREEKRISRVLKRAGDAYDKKEGKRLDKVVADLDKNAGRKGKGRMVDIGGGRKVFVPAGETLDTRKLQKQKQKQKPVPTPGTGLFDLLMNANKR